MIGNEEKQCVVDYPKFPEDCQLLEHVMFENFVGAASSALVFSHPLPPASISSILAAFPTGVNNFKQIEQLPSITPAHRYCAWLPIRTNGNSIHNLYDTPKNMTAMLFGNTGICARINELSYIDSISNILPFFYICSTL